MVYQEHGSRRATASMSFNMLVTAMWTSLAASVYLFVAAVFIPYLQAGIYSMSDTQIWSSFRLCPSCGGEVMISFGLSGGWVPLIALLAVTETIFAWRKSSAAARTLRVIILSVVYLLFFVSWFSPGLATWIID